MVSRVPGQLLRWTRGDSPLLRLRRPASSVSAENYERKTPVEHVLLRPGMYVGQIELAEVLTWVVDPGTQRMTRRQLLYSPALLKIIDEILVNAADNRHRSKGMSYIHISAEFKGKKLRISVENDGATIPLEVHPKEKMYVPELIFGNLLTGSNFDDSKSSVVGGRHGYGAKLTNIFSQTFEVRIYNSQSQKLYFQRWSENMSKVDAPDVKVSSEQMKDFTCISFVPDLPRFQLDSTGNLPLVVDNIMQLLQRRAFDVAACVGPDVKVKFNGSNVPISSFKKYMQLFPADPDVSEESTNESPGLIFVRPSDRWEVGLMKASAADHMSFVNALWTSRGGSHVLSVANQVTKHLEEVVQTKLAKSNGRKGKSESNLYPSATVISAIRNKLFIFVNCLIENPSFDSQGKEYLTTKPASFAKECALPDSFLKEVVNKSGVVEAVVEDFLMREQNKLIKAAKTKSQRSVNIPKLEDAHKAGSINCSLILTEGDSAKALAVAGLEVIGRDNYGKSKLILILYGFLNDCPGVLPLRGKILNVRDATSKQLQENEEVMNIVRAVGLDFTQNYSEGIANKGLRYGRVILMTDQDTDGSHIKGLVINMFEHFWPELLYKVGFLSYIATPLVKVQRAGKNNSVLSFYSLQEYDAWRRSEGKFVDQGIKNIQDYKVKYYKGLGTSTAAEARDYFADTSKAFKSYYAASIEASRDAIDLAFNKERAKDRREWIESIFQSSSYIDPSRKRVTYEDFINKELIQFSFADNVRSIPNAIDGFKPAQRKVLYACFKKKLHSEMKVVQLAGYVAEQTAYHHGEVSLHSTIINMAQDFVGSNNAPLLMPLGQFGTRSKGGKDFASPRYIFTQLSPIARLIFPAADDAQLNHCEEDGLIVEPNHYIPIIPMLLVNGSQGIGTGWSTFIPPHDILDVIELTEALIDGGSPKYQLSPKLNGFKGVITPCKGGFESHGRIHRQGKSHVVITELPYGMQLSSIYTNFLKIYRKVDQ